MVDMSLKMQYFTLAASSFTYLRDLRNAVVINCRKELKQRNHEITYEDLQKLSFANDVSPDFAEKHWDWLNDKCKFISQFEVSTSYAFFDVGLIGLFFDLHGQLFVEDREMLADIRKFVTYVEENFTVRRKRPRLVRGDITNKNK